MGEPVILKDEEIVPGDVTMAGNAPVDVRGPSDRCLGLFFNATRMLNLMNDDVQSVAALAAAHQQLREELGRVIIGQQEVVDQLLTCLFAGGHCLLVGVPGLAKTLLVRTLAATLGPELQPHSVHARPDAVGHYGLRGHPGRPAAGDPVVAVSAGVRSLPT